MTKWIVAIALFSGCGSDCDKLTKKMCEGQDEATCTAIKAWWESELTGPDGKKLSSDEAEVGCKMILDDAEVTKRAVERAREKAKKKASE
jgi:hypothetical protein